MAEQVKLLDPKKLDRNRENPRLIFHQAELDSLEQRTTGDLGSINGIPRWEKILSPRWREKVEVRLEARPEHRSCHCPTKTRDNAEPNDDVRNSQRS